MTFLPMEKMIIINSYEKVYWTTLDIFENIKVNVYFHFHRTFASDETMRALSLWNFAI